MILVFRSCLVNPRFFGFVSGIPPGPYSSPTESCKESILPLEWLDIERPLIDSWREEEDLWNIFSELVGSSNLGIYWSKSIVWLFDCIDETRWPKMGIVTLLWSFEVIVQGFLSEYLGILSQLSLRISSTSIVYFISSLSSLGTESLSFSKGISNTWYRFPIC